MNIFSEGIKITEIENHCLLHITASPEAWLLDAILEKARLRRNALISEWQPRLFADDSVTELPADDEALCAMIMARDDYKTRLQQDVAIDSSASAVKDNIVRYAAVDRSGSTVTLFSNGIDLTDVDVNCIITYIQDLDDWVIGALLGRINKGKKTMLAKYHPIIIADPSVTTMPATEEGLINMIVARSDYRSLA